MPSSEVFSNVTQYEKMVQFYVYFTLYKLLFFCTEILRNHITKNGGSTYQWLHYFTAPSKIICGFNFIFQYAFPIEEAYNKLRKRYITSIYFTTELFKHEVLNIYSHYLIKHSAQLFRVFKAPKGRFGFDRLGQSL